MKTFVIAIIIALLTPITASAYSTMTPREKLRMQAQPKTAISYISPQNLSVIKYRKPDPIKFARYARMGEDAYTRRVLRGLRSALVNNLRKNGRNWDRYFRADAFMGSK